MEEYMHLQYTEKNVHEHDVDKTQLTKLSSSNMFNVQVTLASFSL